MNIIEILHIIIAIIYIILPFLPLKLIIKYKLFILTLFPVILWLIYGECPLVKYEVNNGYRELFTNVGDYFNVYGEFLNILWLILIPNIIILRILYNK